MRKGAAMGFMRKLLAEVTHVRFAPDDTGGARQGLIAAMADLGRDNDDDELTKALSDIADGNTTLAQLGEETILDQIAAIPFDSRDPRSMYIVADELNSILGENNTQLLTFLQVMFDSTKPYDYYLKNTRHLLKDAVLNLLAGTTPTQMALALPAEAVGQGFTSRCIFVHQEQKAARLPEPSLDLEAGAKVSDIFAHVFHNLQGTFERTPGARDLYNAIYMRGTKLDDPRFLHYCERRHIHLRKLSMALAASRGELMITETDTTLADQLLLMTELHMTDALGEYGMNKLGAARQRLIEVIRNSGEPIPTHALFAMVDKDMSQAEFKVTISEFHNAGKVSKVTLPQIGECVVATDQSKARRARKQLKEIEELLALGGGKR